MSKDGKAWFRCQGIRSDVLNKEKKSIGHICMLDIENESLNAVKRLCGNMFDVAFIFESSKTGYHVYNPVIREFEKTNQLMRSIYVEDGQHRSIGYKRGDWVLRVSDKPAASKKVPEYVHSVAKPTKRKTLSAPHLKFIEDYFDVHRSGKIMDKMPTDGKTLEAVEYWTYK